jgi:hypothetical protein
MSGPSINYLIAPYGLGTALSPEQGGTGLDATQAASGLFLTTTGNVQAPLTFSGAPGLPVPTLANVSAYAAWVKVATGITYASFQAGAFTETINLFTLPAGAVILATKLKPTAQWSNLSGSSVITLSIGDTASNTTYSPAFNVGLGYAPSDTYYQVSGLPGGEGQTTPGQITLTCVSTIEHLNNLYEGSVDIWALLSLAV